MKKLVCMIALVAISFGTICVAAPRAGNAMKSDTTMKMKKKKMKSGSKKMKMKKDTTKA